MILVPCLFLSGALPLYLAGALLVLTARLFLRRRAFAARLHGLASLMIALTGATLFFIVMTPWLLIPGAPFAKERLLFVLASMPLTQYPVWILAAVATCRSLAACTGRALSPAEARVPA